MALQLKIYRFRNQEQEQEQEQEQNKVQEHGLFCSGGCGQWCVVESIKTQLGPAATCSTMYIVQSLG